ncbi:TPA: hypothetical protein EYP66_20090 [Candidatus Poribacteria bacterium]|nr:hypothetical protein [Candidatus Poribacteria bacterium]
MEKQIVQTIETTIVETDKFNGIASVGDDVYLYRRLADRYDKTAIAMLNDRDEVIGYLNREIAANKILPFLKRGLKFQCIVTGASVEDGTLLIEIHPILSERSNQISQEAEEIASVRGVGSVAEANFKAIGIFTDAELIQRVEASSANQILAEMKQQNPAARLSVSQIERIYQNAKAKYIPVKI